MQFPIFGEIVGVDFSQDDHPGRAVAQVAIPLDTRVGRWKVVLLDEDQYRRTVDHLAARAKA